MLSVAPKPGTTSVASVNACALGPVRLVGAAGFVEVRREVDADRRAAGGRVGPGRVDARGVRRAHEVRAPHDGSARAVDEHVVALARAGRDERTPAATGGLPDVEDDGRDARGGRAAGHAGRRRGDLRRARSRHGGIGAGDLDVGVGGADRAR